MLGAIIIKGTADFARRVGVGQEWSTGISVVELDDVDELKTLTTVLDKRKFQPQDPREGCPLL